MRKILAVSALVLAMAPEAFASRARIDSLYRSRHLIDMQTAFDRPYQFMALQSLGTFEWGHHGASMLADGSTQNTYRGEAGFLIHNIDYAWGAYFGRRNEAFHKVVNSVREDTISLGTGQHILLLEQNPLSVYYAADGDDISWGLTAKYSSGKDSANGDAKSSFVGITVGASNGTLDVEVSQVLVGTSEVNNGGYVTKIESNTMTSMTLGYHIKETQELYFNYNLADVTGKQIQMLNPPPSQFDGIILDEKTYEVGFVHKAYKTEKVSIFYGLAYKGGNSDKYAGEEKVETSLLPVWLGVEANVTENFTLRGSVAQIFLLNDADKKNPKSDEYDFTAIGGFGYKIGDSVLDAVFTFVKTSKFEFEDNLLSQASYTFNF